MTTKNIVLTLVAVIAGGAAIVIGARNLGGGPVVEPPGEPNYWKCTVASCGEEFSSTRAKYAEFRKSNYEGGMPCPKCGSLRTVSASPCPQCKKYLELIGHGGLPNTCQHCGYTLGNWRDTSGMPGHRPEDQLPPPEEEPDSSGG